VLITGGRVVDPPLSLDALRDVRLDDGIVVEIGEHLRASNGEQIFDASGAVVAPGFIDMHVHLREPGNPEKETIATGTQAAVRGGFTAVACMPNTQPALDAPAVLGNLERLAALHGACRVYPIAAITVGRLGAQLCDYRALHASGAVAFSDDGNTVANARVLRDAALQARDVPGAFISHCEDELLKGDGVMNEGDVSRSLGLPGSPALAEDAIVARDLLIALETGKAWHIAHLTTARALDLVRYVRTRGARVTCEASPHHLTFTDELVAIAGAGAKVNPPLRLQHDVDALRTGVRDGTIDVLATDHAPHTAAEKSGDVRNAAVGFSGLEIAVGAYAAALPELDAMRFISLLSSNPARILCVPGGTLAVGSPADVTIFADRPWTVDPANFASKGKSTPFAGRVLPRRILATIVAGELRYAAATE
jgi:dihydroorotase